MKTHFHIKGYAPRLILKKWGGGGGGEPCVYQPPPQNQLNDFPSKNRPGIPAEFQWNSRSGLDSGRSPPEFRVTETRNSGFRWIPGLEFWSPADSGIRVLESGGIPGLEFCHVMTFQSRVRSPAEFRVWSSGVRLKIWGPAEFQTLVLLHLSAVITDAWMHLKVFH